MSREWANPKTGYGAVEFATPQKGHGLLCLIYDQVVWRECERGRKTQATARNWRLKLSSLSGIYFPNFESRNVPPEPLCFGFRVPSGRVKIL